jgi:hypothetical protein
MKKNQYAKHNYKVLESLRDFFRSFNDCSAVIGRNSTLIAIDSSKLSSFTLNEIEVSFASYFIQAECAFRSLFIFVHFDNDIFLMRSSFSLQSKNEAHSCADYDLRIYPGFNEIYDLLHALPIMSNDLSEKLELKVQEFQAHWSSLVRNNRKEILDCIFNGDTEDDFHQNGQSPILN